MSGYTSVKISHVIPTQMEQLIASANNHGHTEEYLRAGARTGAWDGDSRGQMQLLAIDT